MLRNGLYIAYKYVFTVATWNILCYVSEFSGYFIILTVNMVNYPLLVAKIDRRWYQAKIFFMSHLNLNINHMVNVFNAVFQFLYSY